MGEYNFEIISKTINLIEINLLNNLTIKNISSQLYLSNNHLQNLFIAYTDFTIYDYIKRRRLTEAAKKLLSSNLSILDISIEYCYNSQEAFTRAFKKIFQITPAKYRKENKHRFYCYCERLNHNIITLKANYNSYSKTPTITYVHDIYLYGKEKIMKFSQALPEKIISEFVKNNNSNTILYSIFKYNCLFEELNPHSICCFFIGEPTQNKNLVNYIIPAGKYAIFKFYGHLNNLWLVYKYIFSIWVPNSCYKIRNSLDFEVHLTPHISSDMTTVLIYVPII